MQAHVRDRLLQLNQRFYRQFGQAYAEKRAFYQPGMARLLDRVPPEATVLDVGCGHGRVISMLAEGGFRGRYIGLDASPVLLDIARARAQAVTFPVRLLVRDLARPDWAADLPQAHVVLCFSVLHHLPGRDLRVQVWRNLAARLRPGGWLAVSVWNLLRSPRRKARVRPWTEAGLHPHDVDPGDLLMDWRHRGHGLRYIHQYTLPELEAEARQAGLRLREAFLDDGENRRLGLYAVFGK